MVTSALPMELHSVERPGFHLYRTWQESCRSWTSQTAFAPNVKHREAEERDGGSPGTLVACDVREVHREDFWELHRRLGEFLS